MTNFRSYTSLEYSQGLGSPEALSNKQYSFGSAARYCAIGQDGKISTIAAKKNSLQSEKGSQYLFNNQTPLFYVPDAPKNLDYASLIQHQAQVAQQYRKDLVESYNGRAQLVQQNAYLKAKLRQTNNQNHESLQTIKQENAITQLNKYQIKEVTLVQQLNQIKQKNNQKQQIISKYRTSYQKLQKSYQQLQQKLNQLTNNSCQDTDQIKVKAKGSVQKTDFLQSLEDRQQQRSRVVSQGFIQQPIKKTGSNKWNKQQFKLNSIKSVVKSSCGDQNHKKQRSSKKVNFEDENSAELIKDQLYSFKKKYDQKSGKINQLKQQLQKQKSEKEYYKQLLQQNQQKRQIQILKAQLQQKQIQLQEHQQQINSLNQKIIRLKQNNDMLTSISVSFNKDMIQLQQQLLVLKQQKNNLNQKFLKLKGKQELELQQKDNQNQEKDQVPGQIQIRLHETNKQGKWKVSRMTKRQRINMVQKKQTPNLNKFDYFSRDSKQFTGVEDEYVFSPE